MNYLKLNKIAEAAIDILNEDGIKYLSIEEVEKRIGSDMQGLSSVIKDPDDLYELVAEYICHQVSLTPTDNEYTGMIKDLLNDFKHQLLNVRDSVEVFRKSKANTPSRMLFFNTLKDYLILLNADPAAVEILRSLCIELVFTNTEMEVEIARKYNMNIDAICSSPFLLDHSYHFDVIIDMILTGIRDTYPIKHY